MYAAPEMFVVWLGWAHKPAQWKHDFPLLQTFHLKVSNLLQLVYFKVALVFVTSLNPAVSTAKVTPH
jgi:hypothetical protein